MKLSVIIVSCPLHQNVIIRTVKTRFFKLISEVFGEVVSSSGSLTCLFQTVNVQKQPNVDIIDLL